jgi:hypothetical protein
MTTALLVLTFACKSKELPADFGGEPFWEAVTFEDAEDLGHEPQQIASPLAPGRITLADVTEAAGLGGAIAGGNTHGVGVAFVDLTGDELPDIFVANGISDATRDAVSSKLYQNRGDGTFADVTSEWGLDAIADKDCFSVAAADYDHDGDIDLYLGTRPTDVLLQNQGDRFADVTAEAGAGGPPSADLFGDGRSKVVAFGDYDMDGWLDIVSSSSTLPRPFAYLLRNRGDGTFEDVSERTGVQANTFGNPCAVMWSDHDNDRDPDLWIWNDRGGHILLVNEEGERLVDFTEGSRLDEVDINHPMGIDAADLDHDGDLDFYISNIGNNPLLRNNGDGTFTDITREAGTQGSFGWGLAFEDFDLDAWPDIFVAQEDDLPNLVFRNNATEPPTFDEIRVPHPGTRSDGAAHNKAVAFADYDRDGRVDVVVAGTDASRINLYRNETDPGTGRWLYVSVVRAPQGGNLRAIGARVLVKTGDLVQFRDVTAGSSRASQNEHTVRFGLGEWTGAEWVAVQWPSGGQTVVRNVEGNRRLVMEFE